MSTFKSIAIDLVTKSVYVLWWDTEMTKGANPKNLWQEAAYKCTTHTNTGDTNLSNKNGKTSNVTNKKAPLKWPLYYFQYYYYYLCVTLLTPPPTDICIITHASTQQIPICTLITLLAIFMKYIWYSFNTTLTHNLKITSHWI